MENDKIAQNLNTQFVLEKIKTIRERFNPKASAENTKKL